MNTEQLTKRVLAESLKELMRIKPLDRITTDEICSNAGTSRRNFYRHFTDKYALLEYVYYVDFVVDSIHYDEWYIWDYLPGICRHFYKDPKFYANAFSLRGQNSFREYCESRLYPLLAHDFRECHFSDKQEQFFIHHICEAQFDSFEEWLAMDPIPDPDRYAEHCKESLMKLVDVLHGNVHSH